MPTNQGSSTAKLTLGPNSERARVFNVAFDSALPAKVRLPALSLLCEPRGGAFSDREL
jgi:hypothetical protein